MESEKKKFLIATSVLVGTCIGAGVLGIPYVAAQAGFFVALAYILLIGAIILFVNLYLGEISLRTKGKYQLPGYAEEYLGKKKKWLMGFATVFGIYSAIVAYILGIGDSFSFLIFGNLNYGILLGVLFGLFMSALLWKGLKSLKRFEKWGVGIIFLLLIGIFCIFVKDVDINNLIYFNFTNIFLPFGVVLFALMSFHAIPEANIILKKDKKMMKKIIFTGTLISVIFYILFALVVVGFKGLETPQIATLALGKIFVVLGIFTMFTSYLALGNALREDFMYDDKFKKRKAWFLASIIPIFIFVIVEMFDFFSFTRILSIGGVVSGGLIGVLVLFMVRKAKKTGERKPEYSLPINWWIIGILSLIFVLGVVREIWMTVR